MEGYELYRNGKPYYVKGLGGDVNLDLVVKINNRILTITQSGVLVLGVPVSLMFIKGYSTSTGCVSMFPIGNDLRTHITGCVLFSQFYA